MQVRTVGEPTLRAYEGVDSLFLSGIRMAGRNAAALLHEVVIDPSLEYPSQSLLLNVKLTRRELKPQTLEDSPYHGVWRGHFVIPQHFASLQSWFIWTNKKLSDDLNYPTSYLADI
jgi:hypothetical protein